MMKDDNKLTLWERYLTSEIGIEFKACLYFFAILFFYCMYRLVCGSHEASILHMTEMILACYIICYIQVYAFANFDEADEIRGREIAGIIVCTLLYCIVSYACNWYERKLIPTLIMAAYILLVYLCVFLIYRIKRRIDDKKLNEELEHFKHEHQKSE